MPNLLQGNTFSIVVPVYNAEKYIEATIKSVIDQTYDKWELILIDDGSTDSSFSICERYQNEKIKVYHYENGGQMVARYNGIQKANNTYTIIVDADDTLERQCLELVNDKIQDSEVDMAFFAFNICDKYLKNKNAIKINTVHDYMNQKELLNYIIINRNHQLWNKAIRTSLIKSGAELATKKKLRINGDYALVIPTVCYIKTALIIDEALYNYRVIDDSISHKYCEQHLQDTDFVGREVIRLLKEFGICDEELIKEISLANSGMILMILNGLYESKKLSRDILKKVLNLPLFSESQVYESKQTLGYVNYLELSIYRKEKERFYFVISLIQGLRNIKHRIERVF